MRVWRLTRLVSGSCFDPGNLHLVWPWISDIQPFVVFSVAPLFFVILLGCSYGSEHLPRENSPVNAAEEDEPIEEARTILAKAGFSPSLVTELVSVNGLLLRVAYEEDRNCYQTILATLSRLGRHYELHPLLLRCPEMASFAAGALEKDAAAAKLILETIPNDERQREVVQTMYTFCLEPDDAILLAKRLAMSRDIMIELWPEGPVYMTPFLQHFSGPDADAAEKIYTRWVQDVYLDALSWPQLEREEKLQRAFALLTCHGDTVKRFLLADSRFRRAFLETYWPRYQNIVREKVEKAKPEQKELVWCEVYGDPRVWRFLYEFDNNNTLDAAFKILEKYGCVAVDLWLSPEFQEGSVKKKLLETLESADEQLLNILAHPTLRSQPLFIQFLKRDLPRSVHLAGLRQLEVHLGNPQKVSELLSYWAGLSNAALAEELGPPPTGPVTWIPGYQVYYLLHKAQQGREVDSFDMLFAVVDAASFIPVGGGTAKVLTVARKQGAEMLAEGVAKQSLKRSIVEATEKIGERQIARTIAPTVVRESLSLARTDITNWVRFGFRTFKEFGLGRNVFRNVTGLEPRIFMRRDRCVFLNLGELVSDHSPLGRVLRETAMNAGTDLALSSPAGSAMVHSATETAHKAWRQYFSAAGFAAALVNTKPNMSEGKNEEQEN